MSDTIVDMPKVTQMLDAGWRVSLRRVSMGSYVAEGNHDNESIWHTAKKKLFDSMVAAGWEKEQAKEMNDDDMDVVGLIDTDDFTPEQALTRLAYKVHGEII